MMDQIYTQAIWVISWLGEENRLLDSALLALGIVNSFPRNDLLPSFDVKAHLSIIERSQWIGLASLLSRPYFRRAWVVQEVALANDLIVVCGSRVIKWEDLSSCCEFLQQPEAWVMLSSYASIFRPPEEHLAFKRWRPPLRLGQQVSAVSEIRATVRRKDIPPETLFLLGRQFDATELKDKLYAMHGMATYRLGSADVHSLPDVDYGKGLREISIEYAKYHVEKSQSLRIMLFREDHIYRTQKGLPSWVPNPVARLLPLPIVNILPRSPIGASRLSTTESNTYRPLLEGATLVVFGSQIGIIDKTATSFNTIIETNDWAQFFNFLLQITWSDGTGLRLGEAVWRTLTMSSSPGGKGKEVGTDPDLDEDFRDWCASLAAVEQYQESVNLIQSQAAVFAVQYRFEDMKFDRSAFGNDAGRPTTDVRRGLQRNDLLFNSYENHEIEKEDGQQANLLHRLEDSLWRLWEKDRDDIFPSPDRARQVARPSEDSKVEDQGDILGKAPKLPSDTTAYRKPHQETAHPHTDLSDRRAGKVYSVLGESSPPSSDSPTRMKETTSGDEIQVRVDRFIVAVGTKLDSRKMFITKDSKLGLGPHSLEISDEIWVVKGADMPLVLRTQKEVEFQLVGAAFVLGFGAVSDENGHMSTIRLL